MYIYPYLQVQLYISITKQNKTNLCWCLDWECKSVVLRMMNERMKTALLRSDPLKMIPWWYMLNTLQLQISEQIPAGINSIVPVYGGGNRGPGWWLPARQTKFKSLNPRQDFRKTQDFWKTQLPIVQFHRSLVGPRLGLKIIEWHKWHCKGILGSHNRNALLLVLLQQMQTLFMCPSRKIIHIHHEGETPDQKILYSEYTKSGSSKALLSLQ